MLGLPYTYLYLGWAGGTVTMALAWIVRCVLCLHFCAPKHMAQGQLSRLLPLA